MDKTKLFVFIVMFWSLVLITFAFIGTSLVVPKEYTEFNKDTMQTQNGFSLLFKIMFFSLPPNYEVPYFIPTLLDVIAIFSIYVTVTTLLGFIFPAS